MRNRKLWLRHLVGWFLYIVYELACIEFSVGLKGSVLHFAFFYGFYISLFYVNAYALLNFTFYKTSKPVFFSTVLVIVELSIFYLLKVAIDHYLYPTPIGWKLMWNKQYLLSNIFRELYYVVGSTAIWFVQYSLKLMDKNFRAETQRFKQEAHNLILENKVIQAENAFLQSQISPHLLFNSLNFIYSSVYRLSESAGSGVMLLSNLMRYSLNSGTSDEKVTISQEMDQVEGLIEINRLRFDGELYIRIRKKGKIAQKRIIPLVLVTVVENMIKHGDLSSKRSPGILDLIWEDDRLKISASNPKRPSPLSAKVGIGLQNLQRRLANSYPGLFTIKVIDEKDYFSLTILITLS